MNFINLFQFGFVVLLYVISFSEADVPTPITTSENPEREIQKNEEYADAWKFWLQSKCWMIKMMKYTNAETKKTYNEGKDLCSPSGGSHRSLDTSKSDSNNTTIILVSAIMGAAAVVSQIVVLLFFVVHSKRRHEATGHRRKVKEKPCDIVIEEIDNYQDLPELLPPHVTRTSHRYSIGIDNNGKENIYATPCSAQDTYDRNNNEKTGDAGAIQKTATRGGDVTQSGLRPMSAPPEYATIDKSERKSDDQSPVSFINQSFLPDTMSQTGNQIPEINRYRMLLPVPSRSNSLYLPMSTQMNENQDVDTNAKTGLNKQSLKDNSDESEGKAPRSDDDETSLSHVSSSETHYDYADMSPDKLDCPMTPDHVTGNCVEKKGKVFEGYTDMSRNASVTECGSNPNDLRYDYVEGNKHDSERKLDGYERMDGNKSKRIATDSRKSSDEYVKAVVNEDELY